MRRRATSSNTTTSNTRTDTAIAVDVPFTEAMIHAAIDVRLPLSFAAEDLEQMGKVLLAAVEDTMGEAADEVEAA